MQKALYAIGFALLLIAATPDVGAQKMYRWVDAQGNVHFGDRPPVGANEIQPKSNAGTKSDTKASTVVAEKENECETLKQRLASYRSASELIQQMPDGTKRSFTEAERARVVQRTESAVAKACEEA